MALEPVCRECGSAGGRAVTVDMEKAYMLAERTGIDTSADVDRFFDELGLLAFGVGPSGERW